MRTIIAIGGTGQTLLFHYFQLYWTGVIDTPFRAVVVDTDDVHSGLSKFEEFLDNLKYGDQPGSAFRTQVPQLKTVPVNITPADDVQELVTGMENPPSDRMHPARAFFARDALEQQPQRGLFARPALSSVVTQGISDESTLTPDETDPTVVVIGSVVGGTGGGLTAKILDVVRRNTSTRPLRLRAVLYGQYFEVDDGVLEGGESRTRSNQTLVLKTLEAANNNLNLHSYHIVGGPGENRVRRNPNREKTSKQLPFPNESHPHWQGIRALHYMMTENYQDVRPTEKPFHSREVSESTVNSIKLDYEHAQRRFLESRAVADAIVNHEIIERIGGEPWVKSVWGRDFPKFLAHFWGVARESLGTEETHRFPSETQSMIGEHWEGKTGLRRMLPSPSKGQSMTVRPYHFRQIRWPPSRTERRDETLFEGVEAPFRRAAATTLFYALRDSPFA